MNAKLCIAIALSTTVLLAGCGGKKEAPLPEGPAQRIVSLAPNFTEIIYALGIEDKLVGVTRFCTYPEEAKQKAIVGGFADPDLERVVALRPDLVLAVTAIVHNNLYARLEQLGIPVLVLGSDSIDQILDNIRDIADAAGESDRGRALIADIRRRLDAVRYAVSGKPKPRVAFIVGREPFYVVGAESFLHELIEIAGGTNIAGGVRERYPAYSFEQIIRDAPDVIIDSTTGSEMREPGELGDWARYDSIPAVKNGRVHGLDIGVALTPGPRIVDTAQQLARLLHQKQADTREH